MNQATVVVSGFFSEKGDLLAVIFDEVKEVKDHQVLEFDQDLVVVTVEHGKVTCDRGKEGLRASLTSESHVQFSRIRLSS